jgi:glycosyltransferase involved in cell wall biosynthesis
MKLGIYCPSIQLGFYNTDYLINREFKRIIEFSNINTEFLSDPLYTLSFNVDKISNKLFRDKFNLLIHKLPNKLNVDLIYHYGHPKNGIIFFKKINNIPCVVTTGFRTDKQIIASYGFLSDRKHEADILAQELEKASLIHFHTINGRERFLYYRPEFKQKSVSIPFFLPSLASFNEITTKSESKMSILFVGYDGDRKGLPELIEAFEQINSDFLKENNVEINIVSKIKPKSKTNLSFNWWSKLSHNEVLDLMKDTNIFVLVPKYESYGLVLIEAMANSCAIITDDDLTRLEIIDNCGRCIPSGNINRLKDTLVELIGDKVKTRELGEKAFIRYIYNYSPRIVGKLYEDAFSELLKP